MGISFNNLCNISRSCIFGRWKEIKQIPGEIIHKENGHVIYTNNRICFTLDTVIQLRV
jgi:hypothetical protein